MDNEVLFDFMSTMYAEMQSEFKGLKQDVQGLKQDVRGLTQDVRKNSISIDNIEKNLKQLAEIQQNHYEENQRDHKQIVEMLTARLDTQDIVIKNIKIT